VAAAENKFVGY